jgi:GT2 family glycosyltransferase
MHNRPRVSIVVLGYNEERFLDGCLAAVLDQDYPRDQYEVLFVDNGSSDGSLALTQERFPEIRTIPLDRNYGFGGGNNRGAAHVRGDLVVFLNADTVVHQGWLGGLVRAIDADPQVKACSAAGLAPDCPGFEAMEREALPPHVYYADIVRFGHVGLNRIRSDAPPRRTLHLAGCTAMLDLSILEELEYLFDEDFFLDGDDTDLGLRINSLGYRMVVVPEAVFYHLAKNVPARLKLSWRTLQRMVHMHRNRLVAYYRNMHTAEFILALPVLLLGSPLKPFTFMMSLGRKLAYAAAIVPVTWYAFAQAALIHFPRHAEKRRRILQRRRREPFWFLKQIIRRKSYNE